MLISQHTVHPRDIKFTNAMSVVSIGGADINGMRDLEMMIDGKLSEKTQTT